jgi:RNA polymerase sigma-70 factor (ECF subfamily)
MLLKMVNNKSDAEDLTIEAFGKAFKNLHLYTPTYAFSTWLFKIASNNGIDFLRSRRVKQRYVSIDTEHDDEINKAVVRLKSENKDPEESMIKEQKEKLMRLVVRKLNPNYRNIITMRYFDEMSYVEIAEKLDLPLGTVKARLHRSRELLANILKTSTDLDD